VDCAQRGSARGTITKQTLGSIFWNPFEGWPDHEAANRLPGDLIVRIQAYFQVAMATAASIIPPPMSTEVVTGSLKSNAPPATLTAGAKYN
jgi:hypothetical protein